MSEMPVVYAAKCDGCGLCVSVCACGSLVLIGNVVTIIEQEDCGWCAQCEFVCSTGAIVCPLEIVFEEK